MTVLVTVSRCAYPGKPLFMLADIMRIVTRVLPVVVTFLTLTGCVSRVGPAAAPAVPTLPSRSPVAGEQAWPTDAGLQGVIRLP